MLRQLCSGKTIKVNKVAKIRNRYNQVPHLTQDTNGKVTNSQKTPQTRAQRSALSQQVTTIFRIARVRFPLGIIILGIIFNLIYFLSYDHIVSCLF